ncbi:MAG: hypothetical protein HOV68_10395 [Streptomycetaceae bacterium]|nr:hypothetical protein [Streptomycetaceae bacterium]
MDLVRANLTLSQFRPIGKDNDPRKDDFKDVQTLLGGHLAAASPALAEDAAWMTRLKEIGAQKFQVAAKDGAVMTDVYGYQVFGTLLGQGTVNKDFLLMTAEDVREFEKSNGGPSVWGHSAAWDPMYPLGLNGGGDPKARNASISSVRQSMPSPKTVRRSRCGTAWSR